MERVSVHEDRAWQVLRYHTRNFTDSQDQATGSEGKERPAEMEMLRRQGEGTLLLSLVPQVRTWQSPSIQP